MVMKKDTLSTKANINENNVFPWGTNRRYNAFVDYAKQIFGSRIQKVIVDAGFTCPNRDGSKGYGGCIYCNNESFKPRYSDPEKNIINQVETGINFLSKRYKVDKFIVYFQPFSNTYAPLEHLKFLYGQVLSHPQVIGISIGTRPDCIDEEKIEYLEQLARDYYVTIEYGLESPYDKTLKWINRQHDFNEWVDAVKMTAGKGIHICSHIILGFPTESKTEMLETAYILSQYPIDYLKIHHLHIVENTILEKKYRDKPFQLFSYEEYLQLVIDFLQHLKPEIKIQRLMGETPPSILIAPQWRIRADEIHRRIHMEMVRCGVWQGRLYNSV